MESSKEKVAKEKAPPTKPSDMLLDLDDCKSFVDAMISNRHIILHHIC